MTLWIETHGTLPAVETLLDQMNYYIREKPLHTGGKHPSLERSHIWAEPKDR